MSADEVINLNDRRKRELDTHFAGTEVLSDLAVSRLRKLKARWEQHRVAADDNRSRASAYDVGWQCGQAWAEGDVYYFEELRMVALAPPPPEGEFFARGYYDSVRRIWDRVMSDEPAIDDLPPEVM
jgi:hypothetical protein